MRSFVYWILFLLGALSSSGSAWAQFYSNEREFERAKDSLRKLYVVPKEGFLVGHYANYYWVNGIDLADNTKYGGRTMYYLNGECVYSPLGLNRDTLWNLNRIWQRKPEDRTSGSFTEQFSDFHLDQGIPVDCIIRYEYKGLYEPKLISLKDIHQKYASPFGIGNFVFMVDGTLLRKHLWLYRFDADYIDTVIVIPPLTIPAFGSSMDQLVFGTGPYDEAYMGKPDAYWKTRREIPAKDAKLEYGVVLIHTKNSWWKKLRDKSYCFLEWKYQVSMLPESDRASGLAFFSGPSKRRIGYDEKKGLETKPGSLRLRPHDVVYANTAEWSVVVNRQRVGSLLGVNLDLLNERFYDETIVALEDSASSRLCFEGQADRAKWLRIWSPDYSPSWISLQEILDMYRPREYDSRLHEQYLFFINNTPLVSHLEDIHIDRNYISAVRVYSPQELESYDGERVGRTLIDPVVIRIYTKTREALDLNALYGSGYLSSAAWMR